ncbi:MAG: riboflavin synthase [Bacteroidetes bacterium]|nr:MAG: riboflavin synthase [Bacteroidota bacterium]
MFTGIIETMATVLQVQTNGTNKTFTLSCALATEFKVDQSVSHNGVCLTVEKVNQQEYQVTAIEETLVKTNLNTWKPNTAVNIERCLLPHSRLDGHFVQGHVDTVGTCEAVIVKDGSWEYTISFPEKFAALVIEKGSIALNGTSLTVFNVTNTTFTVAIIPYTYEHTTIQFLEVGTPVNIEFDMVGKYIQRFQQLK